MAAYGLACSMATMAAQESTLQHTFTVHTSLKKNSLSIILSVFFARANYYSSKYNSTE